MSSIYKRSSDGRWVASIDIPSNGFKRTRRSFASKTRAGALRKLSEAQAGMNAGLAPANNQMTVGSYLRNWLVSIQPTVRTRTFTSYQGAVNNHISPAIGGIKLSLLQPDHIETMLRDLADELSPATARQIHAVLKTALTKAEKWGLVGRNVAKIADGPRVPKTEAQSLTADEARRLIAASDPLVTLAIMTGLRRGELIALRWDNINLGSGTLKVTHTMTAGELAEPKSDRSRRTITLPGACTQALKENKHAHATQKLKSGRADYNSGGFVFVYGPGGDPLTPAQLYKRFDAALKNSGVRRVKFHALRHTCASMMLEKGIAPHTVAKVLGHSNISLTLEIYSHVSTDQQDEAARVMDGLVG